MTDLSLIIPVYNEAKSLPLLYDSIKQVMEPIKQKGEVVYLDDGSTDERLHVLQSFIKKDPWHIRAVVFRRNVGQTAAIAAGIDHAHGETIILRDADLQ